MRVLRFFVLLFCGIFLCGAGEWSFATPPNREDFILMNDFFAHQKNHIPGSVLNTSPKTLDIAINVWQDDEGQNNLPQEDFIYESIHQVIHWLNRFFSLVDLPVKPIEGVEYLRDSHLRFHLREITFFRNTALNRVGCNDGHRLNAFAMQEYPHKQRYLNIHFVTGNCMGASGYANYPVGASSQAHSYVVSFMRSQWEDFTTYPFWALMLHLAHELGHNLDLRHPYDSEYCTFSHPDFLFDLFGFEKQPWCVNPRRGCDICFHQGGWDCDFTDPQNTCTNNIMGGNKDNGSITPLQMGRMHRALSLKSVRKYAWGYNPEPLLIQNNELWELNIKIYQDIVIRSGATLWLKGDIEMVPEAQIIVEPGARLIVDGGSVQTALLAPAPWRGVMALPGFEKGFLFWRKKVPPGEVILLNQGRIAD